MWQCRTCQEKHQDSFEVCWNCGTAKDGTEDPTFRRADAGADAANEGEQSIALGDLRSGRQRAVTHTVDQLIFVGLNGYALALDRDSGEVVWSNDQMKSGYVSLLLDGDRLIVSTNGYMYCLDPLTGRIRWHNPLQGYGMGAPTAIVSVRGQSSQTLVQQAEADAAADS